MIILYKNGDVDVVSCKCFNDMDYVVFIEDGKRCTIKPELGMFEKLHKGKKIKLPDGNTLKKNNNVRLVLLLKSMHKQLPYEVYKVYKLPEELPQSLSYSKRKIEKGVLSIAKWIDNS